MSQVLPALEAGEAAIFFWLRYFSSSLQNPFKGPQIAPGPTAGGFSFGEKEEERLKVEVRGPRWQFEFPGRSFAFAASPEWGMLGRASRVLRVSQALHPQASYPTYHFVQ